MNKMQVPIYWIILLLILFLSLASLLGRFLSLWFQAFVSGTPISLSNIIGMSLRKIPSREIVTAYINAHKAGLKDITVSDLETHYMAGGRVVNVVLAMIAAEKAGIPLKWKQATAIDLAGRDVLEAVRTSVNPKVIDCPKEKDQWISAVAKNGVELLSRARVTVRTNLSQLVGGAKEETIIARVGEGIVSAIGSASDHFKVLENPQEISKSVLEKGLDVGTAFEILSIDIADINVGKNIGAQLRIDQAAADEKIAQAEAEKRRAMAVAQEQEMRAHVVEAEAEVPKAIAQAFCEGNLGVMDYRRLQNVEADTAMREKFAQKRGLSRSNREKKKK